MAINMECRRKKEVGEFKPALVILMGLFAMTLVFMFQSQLNILLPNGNSGTDSSVFRTVALQMKNGMMPYRDSFDHKGPLIYIFNYLGILIRQSRGVWIIEFASVFSAFAFMYRTARIRCSRRRSFLVLAICTAPLYAYFEGGNLTEEYALPFIAMALYIFTDYFINDRISVRRLIFCGLGFGAVCMLRINMVAVWAVCCCAVLLQGVITGQIKTVLRYLPWFLLGAGIVVGPICCWLLAKGAFMDFINDYFVFNAMYTRAGEAALLAKYNVFSVFLNNTYVLTAIIATCFAWDGSPFFQRTYLAYEIVGLLLVSMSGRNYAHYGMILVPMLVYPFSILLSKRFTSEKPWIWSFVMYLLIVLVVPAWIGGVNKMAGYCLMENRTWERTDIAGEISKYVKENSKEDDRIIVWGNWNNIYVLSQRLPASKYSYQFPISDIDRTILLDFFEELEESPPKIIVIGMDMELGEMESFINEHGYTSVYKVDGASLIYEKIVDEAEGL